MPTSRSALPTRLASLCAGLVLCLPAAAQDIGSLPDMGSSAAELITPAKERAYGRQVLGELRRVGWLLEDPLLDAWLQSMGHRLASNGERPEQRYTFFLLRSRDINAFATLGGFIGLNAGLVMTAEREDEVAAVLAHEITHVTQRHVVRAVERAQKDTLPIALAMLGAIVAAQQTSASGDATQAVIASGIALMQQRQINHTRSSEHEADRIGIQILARSGYDPAAMADFFGRMQRALRSQGEGPPEFLRTHPVTTTRIAEAKERAAKLATGGHACVMTTEGDIAECSWTPAGSPGPADLRSQDPLHPAFPTAWRDALREAARDDVRRFDWARERMRMLSAASPADAVAEYARLETAGELDSDAQRYGYALAQTEVGRTESAIATLEMLAQRHPDFFWLDLALAEAEHRDGSWSRADRRYRDLLENQPESRAIALSYAQALAERGDAESGRRAQDVLRPLLIDGAYDAMLQHAFARASETAGDIVRAGEAYAENAFLSGRAEDALNQLQRLKQRDDLDYVQRSRIDARIAAISPIVLELRAQGIRPAGRGNFGEPQGQALRQAF